MHSPDNQLSLLHTDVHPQNVMAMVVSLEHRLREGSDEDVERRFFMHTLRYLTTSSGRRVEMEDWMVTSYEVEFGQEIGSGGLYVFSTFPYSEVYLLMVGFRQWKGIGIRQRWRSKYS